MAPWLNAPHDADLQQINAVQIVTKCGTWDAGIPRWPDTATMTMIKQGQANPGAAYLDKSGPWGGLLL